MANPTAYTPQILAPPSGMTGPPDADAQLGAAYSGQTLFVKPPDRFGDDKKLLTYGQDCLKAAMEYRWVYERAWWRNILYLLGRQWIYYDVTRGQWVDKRLAKWMPRPVTNKIAEVQQSILSVFEAVQLVTKVRPGGNAPKDISTAEICDKTEPMLVAEHQWLASRRLSDFWLIATGNVFQHVWWDKYADASDVLVPFNECPACGQVDATIDTAAAQGACSQCGAPMPPNEMATYATGRGATDVISPFEMGVPPGYTSFRQVPWVIRMRWRTKDWCEKTLDPAVAKKIAFSKGSSERSMQLFRSIAAQSDISNSPFALMAGSDAEQGEGTTEYELNVKTNRDYPQGLVLRWIGDTAAQLVRDKNQSLPGPLPYTTVKGNPIWPWVHTPYEQFGGKIWGRSPIDPIIQKQDQVNQIDALIQLIIQRTANPIWLEPKGAEVKKFTGEPGLVVKYNPLIAGGAAKPERISGENVPGSLIQIRTQFMSDIETLAGCLDGDTRIPCLDGVVRTMRELSERFPSGGTWVYGFDPASMRVVPSYVESAWRVGIKPVVRVTFQEGTYLECTADHPILTYTRGYVRADLLEIDEPVVPLILKRAATDGRFCVHQPVDRETMPVSRMVAQVLHGLPRHGAAKLDVHHIDENLTNNLPDNLEVLTRREHLLRQPRPMPTPTREQCSAFAAHSWDGLTPEERTQRWSPMVSGLKRYWATLSVEARAARNRQGWQKLSPAERKTIAYHATAQRTSLSVAARIALSEKQSDAIRQYASEQGAAPARDNHRVMAIDVIGEREVYDLTTATINFGTEAGVFVHNTYDVLKGAKPAGVEAFSAMQLLVERSQSRFGMVLAARGESYRQWLSIALELERQYGAEERFFTVMGPNGKWQIEHFRKADLTGDVQIVIEDGSQAPKTNLGMRAAIQQLQQLQMLRTDDTDQVFAIYKAFGQTALVPQLDADVKSALQEQDEFETWALSPDAAPVQTLTETPDPMTGVPTPSITMGFATPPPLRVEKWHNHPIHMQEHRKWLLGDTGRNLIRGNDAFRQIVDQHLADHELSMMNAAQGLPSFAAVPPVTPPPGMVGAGGARAMLNSNQESANPADVPQGASLAAQGQGPV